jgi:hypothetical protein
MALFWSPVPRCLVVWIIISKKKVSLRLPGLDAFVRRFSPQKCKSRRNTVIFYSDPTLTSLETLDQFDELHINHKKTVRLLIAIFPE